MTVTLSALRTRRTLLPRNMHYDSAHLFTGKEHENVSSAELQRIDEPLAAIVLSNPFLGNRPHPMLLYLSVTIRGKAALLCVSNSRR
jgi:hypothetical protein